MPKITPAGRRRLEQLEELKLTSYQDQGKGKGAWTVGYGHTPGFPNQTISENKADQLLSEDLLQFEEGVTRAVKVQLTPNQFDALVMFSFNVGLDGLDDSSVLRFVNEHEFTEAAASFGLWNKVEDPETGQMVVCEGLTNRRAAEKRWFLEGR